MEDLEEAHKDYLKRKDKVITNLVKSVFFIECKTPQDRFIINSIRKAVDLIEEGEI